MDFISNIFSGDIFGNGFIAVLGGVLPCLIWLAFWLFEDKRHPEPKGYIAETFLLGMLAVPLALFFQNWVGNFFLLGSIPLLLFWAIGEETLKFAAATIGGLSRRANNEPLDSMVYLITAALGYAALENAFFLFGPLQAGDIATSVVAGNFRFLGSTLVHVLSSATIGIFLAYAFCRPRTLKILSVTAGLLLATLLHTLYNILILNTDISFFAIFGGIWAGIVLVLVFFELVKRLNPYCR